MSLIVTLIRRDVRLALSDGMGCSLSLLFFLIVASLIPFVVGPDALVLRKIAGGLVWISALLASLLTLERMFQPDVEDGTLDLMLSDGISAELLACARIISHWLTTCVPLLLAMPMAALVLGLPVSAWYALLISLLIGTPLFSALGSIAAALSTSVRRSGLLIGLLVLPLMVPVLIFGIGSQDIDTGQTSLKFLAAWSLAGVSLSPFATAAALRLSVA